MPDDGRSVLSGVIIDLDKDGKTKQIERILINDDHIHLINNLKEICRRTNIVH